MEGMVFLLGWNEIGDSRAWTAVKGEGKDWANLQMHCCSTTTKCKALCIGSVKVQQCCGAACFHVEDTLLSLHQHTG
ncbi:hypothetical protein CY35_03G081600 [Sphagnum magellanicum]|nr:hypothetical protein CY35_03G081600 [Sphagnum magellanicum]